MTDPDFSLILSQASTAYGWVTGGVLAWRNQAFSRLAEALQITPQQLVESARADLEVATPDGARWEIVQHETPTGLLIELIPGAGSRKALPTDALTGLQNREAIEAELHNRFAKRSNRPFAVAFADLDDFKQVNDRYGHLVGDRCLEVVGERLRRSVRTDDAVGRYGGDEFLILLSGITEPGQLEPVRRRLQACLAEPIEGPDWRAQLGLSLGAAYSTDGYKDPRQMLAVADERMYTDKRSEPAPSTDIADSAKLG